MSTQLRFVPLALFAVIFGVAGEGYAQNALSKSSPFLPAGAAAAAAGASGETIQFAGVSTMGKKTYVSLFDTQTKKARWLALGSTIDGTTVLNYDAERDEVVVRVGGTQKLLTLRKAKGIANGPTPGMAQNMNFVFAPATVPSPVSLPPLPMIGPGPGMTPTGAVGNGQVPVLKPVGPPIPQSQAKQETEARMLVSDLLEIGMAQRKAYEDAQKKASQPGGQTLPSPQPSAQAPQPVPAAPGNEE